jgi:hypothetical protein
MLQNASSIYPLVEWERVEDVSYDGMPVFRHPGNGELGYDDGSYLLGLPATVEQAIRDGQKGRF